MYNRALEVAKNAARKAGDLIMEVYSDDFIIDYKDDKSPVTLADKKADDLIVGILKKNFPDYAILSEESVDDKSRLNNKYCWIVDPLDGTRDFINKTDEFSINIALVEDNKPVVGVIYIPTKDELYFSIKGEGSFLEKDGCIKENRVSNRASKLRLLCSKFHKSEEFLDLVEKYALRISAVIGVGSAYKGCVIASGKAEGYFRYGLTCEWDICPMDLIVTEAGGIFRDMDGNEFDYNRDDVYNRIGFYAVNDETSILL